MAESAVQHKSLLFLTLSNSRTEECSSSYAQVLLISMMGSSVDREQPGVCLFIWDPPPYSHCSFPRRSKAWVLTCSLVWQSCSQAGSQCSGEPLGFVSGAQIPISDAFELLLRGATTAGLLLGCLPRAGSYSSLEHWLQKAAFLNPDKANQWQESVHSSSFLPFLLLFLSRSGGGFL